MAQRASLDERTKKRASQHGKLLLRAGVRSVECPLSEFRRNHSDYVSELSAGAKTVRQNFAAEKQKRINAAAVERNGIDIWN